MDWNRATDAYNAYMSTKAGFRVRLTQADIRRAYEDIRAMPPLLDRHPIIIRSMQEAGEKEGMRDVIDLTGEENDGALEHHEKHDEEHE